MLNINKIAIKNSFRIGWIYRINLIDQIKMKYGAIKEWVRMIKNNNRIMKKKWVLKGIKWKKKNYCRN